MGTLRIKRVYDPPSRGDGRRVLVDRLWPRGLKREAARIDLRLKEVAPSDGAAPLVQSRSRPLERVSKALSRRVAGKH